MTTLFQRAFDLVIDNRHIVGLDIEFRIERTLARTGNSAEVRLFNLSQDTRRYLQQRKGGVICELHAGYTDQVPLPRIMLQQLRIVTSVRDGADWITEIKTGDADQAKAQPISFSLGPGAEFQNAVKRVVSEMKAGAGNIAAMLTGRKQYPDGVTVHGFGDDELARMLEAEGFDHSWQDGEIQVRPIGGSINATAVLLTEQTGLIGSPEIGQRTGKQSIGVTTLKARSELNTDIFPGRLVKVESVNISGVYVVSKAVYTGESAGDSWYTDLECVPRQ